MKKKARDIYNESIPEVALEISIDSKWRKSILELKYGEKLYINKNSDMDLPNYIKNIIVENDLNFYVEKVKECEEKFDEGSIIFKFVSVEYKDVVCYTGN